MLPETIKRHILFLKNEKMERSPIYFYFPHLGPQYHQRLFTNTAQHTKTLQSIVEPSLRSLRQVPSASISYLPSFAIGASLQKVHIRLHPSMALQAEIGAIIAISKEKNDLFLNLCSRIIISSIFLIIFAHRTLNVGQE